jgi:hypothetical protein
MAALVPFALWGCGEPAAPDRTLAPGEFVDIIVALRQAEQDSNREAHPDSVEIEFERKKLEILERHNATEEQVRGFMEGYRHKPKVIATAWDSIAHRLRMVPPRVDDETPWREEYHPDQPRTRIPRPEPTRVPGAEELVPDLGPEEPSLNVPPT